VFLRLLNCPLRSAGWLPDKALRWLCCCSKRLVFRSRQVAGGWGRTSERHPQLLSMVWLRITQVEFHRNSWLLHHAGWGPH